MFEQIFESYGYEAMIFYTYSDVLDGILKDGRTGILSYINSEGITEGAHNVNITWDAEQGVYIIHTLSAMLNAKGSVWIWLILLILLLRGYGFARGLYIGFCATDILIYGCFLIVWLPNAYKSQTIDILSAYLILFIVRIIHVLLALTAIILARSVIPSEAYQKRKRPKINREKPMGL